MSIFVPEIGRSLTAEASEALVFWCFGVSLHLLNEARQD
jgi:hypothetical protein